MTTKQLFTFTDDGSEGPNDDKFNAIGLYLMDVIGKMLIVNGIDPSPQNVVNCAMAIVNDLDVSQFLPANAFDGILERIARDVRAIQGGPRLVV
jgi:hypothetical protein